MAQYRIVLERKQRMSLQATASEQDVLCAYCDMPNAAGNAYCVGCGMQLASDAQSASSPAAPPRKLRCGRCGITNPAGAAYCVNCGISLADTGLPLHTPGHTPPLTTGAANTGGALVQHIYIAAPAATAEPPLVARALWFVFVGLWVGQLWLILAWLLNLTVIGLPLGMWMLNRMPQVMTLRAAPSRPSPVPTSSSASLIVRVVYFVLIGWWVSFLWMQFAWLAAVMVIGLPLSFQMFERVGTVMTLAEA
jgi:uncharacterized membrane protein YccF (DUF307 family)